MNELELIPDNQPWAEGVLDCLAVIDEQIAHWKEAMHTDDGDLYREAEDKLDVLYWTRVKIGRLFT